MALQFQLCLLYQAASLLSHIVMFVFLTSQAQPPPHHSKPQHPKPPKPQHTPRHRVLSHLHPHMPCISALLVGRSHSAALAFFREEEKRHIWPEAGNHKCLQHGSRSCSKPAALHPVTDPEQGVCEQGLVQLTRCVGTTQCVDTTRRGNLHGLMAALQPGKGQKRLWPKTSQSLLEQDTSLGAIIWRKSATGLRVIHLTSFKSLPKGRVVTEILN